MVWYGVGYIDVIPFITVSVYFLGYVEGGGEVPGVQECVSESLNTDRISSMK